MYRTLGELCMNVNQWGVQRRVVPAGGGAGLRCLSRFTMPRYLTLENDGYAGLSGPTAVQMPGLRVRPGLISGSDPTLPVTDFAEQAFSVAAGGRC